MLAGRMVAPAEARVRGQGIRDGLAFAAGCSDLALLGIGGQQRRRVQELKARGIQPQPWVRVVAGEDGRWLPALLPGDEHVSLWSREGAIVVYLSQPYSLNETEIAAMAESCEKYGLRVQIAAQPDWHNPGRVFGLLWTRRSESGLWALSETGDEVSHE